MKRRPVFRLLALGLLAAAPACAAGYTVDRLSCLEAQSFVIRHGRYYQASVDGPLPIYPVLPVNKGPACKAKERVWCVIEKTADMSECLVGYQCITQ